MQRSVSTGFLLTLFLATSLITLAAGRATAEDGSPSDGWLVDYLEIDPIQLTRFQPPPAELPPATPPRRNAASRSEPSRRRRSRRLEDAPDMFGDLITRGSVFGDDVNDDPFNSTFPLGRTSKISEHNGVLPNHRVIALYNHFHNSQHTLDFLTSSSLNPTKNSLDRYTIGIERPFGDDLWSVELRMAFLGQSSQNTDVFSISGGDYGNLAVILKRLVYEDDQLAVAIGMGIDTPTGSDLRGGIAADGYEMRIYNQAVHLLPYIGFLSAPTDRLYFQGFAQLDVALNGNAVSLSGDGSFSFVEEGVLTEQNFLYLDLAAGYWIYQNPNANGLTGLAANMEFHYSRALQDRDLVTLSNANFESSPVDGLDILNVTIGLHAALSNSTNVRVGSVFPIKLDGQKCFDAELQAAVVRQF